MSTQGGLTPGNPLGGSSGERSEAGLRPEPENAPAARVAGAPGIAGRASTTPPGVSDPDAGWSAPGYTTSPPPGALRPPAGTFGAPSGLGGQAAGTYVLAGWWRRVGAALIDAVIIGIGAILIYLALGSLFSVGFLASEETGVASVIVGLLVATVAVTIMALAYAPLLMMRTNGRTIGRMATGIRVVRTSGEPMTLRVALLREVVLKALAFGIASSFTAGLAGLVDVLWPLWDEGNRALHDFPVQTRTVMA